MSMFLHGSTHCLLKRIFNLSIPPPQRNLVPTLYQKQQAISKRTITPSSRAYLTFTTRPYTTSPPYQKYVLIIVPGLQRRKQPTIASSDTIHSRLLSTSIDKPQNQKHHQQQQRQQQVSTSIAMIYYAKLGEPGQCLQHFLQLLKSQGTLPSHEAIHQLARILYIKRHLTGFSILHDTLLAYFKINPPSGRQLRNLNYIYTMLINLIIRQQPNKSKQRSTSSYISKFQRSIHQCPASSSPSESPVTPPFNNMENKTATIIHLCQEMQQLGLSGSPAFYNSLLKFCVMKKDSTLAQSLYKELVNICPPTSYTYSILLDLARQQKDSGLILQVLDRMELDGIAPDRPMVSTMMLALCDHQQYMAAIDFVERLDRYAPQIMGSQYKSVLMDSIKRHYQQYQRELKRNRKQYPQKKKRKHGAQQLQQPKESSPSTYTPSSSATTTK